MRGLSAAIAGVVFALALLPGIAGTGAQEKPSVASQGLFLVARPEMPDPLFAKTIVLMLPVKGVPGIVGLIVNKPTKVPMHDLYTDSPALEKRDATAYFGGPVDVEVSATSAIFRSAAPPKDATQVFGDVYVSFDPDTIAALVENVQQVSTLRVFLGRSEWAPEQLQNEIARGAWYSVRSGADSIFGKFPEAAWRALLEQAEPRPLTEYQPPFFPLRSVAFSL
jgi:putative transcriptional regulator